MSNILLLAIIFFVLITTPVAVYYNIYKSKINKRIINGETGGRKLLSPLNFLIIVILVILILFSGVVSFAALYMNSHYEKQNNNEVYTFDSFNSGDNPDSYQNNYSLEENIGYTKYIEQVGDVRFTRFIRNDSYDTFHPSFIVFAEYTGKNTVLHYGLYGKYYTLEDSLLYGLGYAGSEYNDYFCVIGNSSDDCKFSLTVYFYDSLNKSEDMSEYAISEENLTFIIPK